MLAWKYWISNHQIQLLFWKIWLRIQFIHQIITMINVDFTKLSRKSGFSWDSVYPAFPVVQMISNFKKILHIKYSNTPLLYKFHFRLPSIMIGIIIHWKIEKITIEKEEENLVSTNGKRKARNLRENTREGIIVFLQWRDIEDRRDFKITQKTNVGCTRGREAVCNEWLYLDETVDDVIKTSCINWSLLRWWACPIHHCHCFCGWCLWYWFHII